ncbi:MAG: glycosyltransferase, partial [Spirochaetota bacterium]
MDSQTPVNRVTILGVPVDILPVEGIDELVVRFADGKNHQIVLLSLWDLMRARRVGEFRTMIAGASLVLPISVAITKGARFLRKAEPIRYMPF